MGMPVPVVVTETHRKRTAIGLLVLALFVAAIVWAVRHENRTPPHNYAAKSAVSVLLKAGESGNVALVKKALCAQDEGKAKHELGQLLSDGKVTSYQVDAATTLDGKGVVEATVSTAGHGVTVLPFPVVLVGVGWHVCPSELPGAVTFAGVPASRALCTTVSNLPGVPAAAYVDAAAAGLVGLAQSCVYHGDVPASVAQSLRGKSLSADAAALRTDGPYVFTGSGTTLVVTVSHERDGHDYVTAVRSV
jgi:hypothetical protein